MNKKSEKRVEDGDRSVRETGEKLKWETLGIEDEEDYEEQEEEKQEEEE